MGVVAVFTGQACKNQATVYIFNLAHLLYITQECINFLNNLVNIEFLHKLGAGRVEDAVRAEQIINLFYVV